jgi:hypothetical protein
MLGGYSHLVVLIFDLFIFNPFHTLLDYVAKKQAT